MRGSARLMIGATLPFGGIQTVVSQSLSKLVENHLILLLIPVTPPAAPYYGSEYLGSYTGSSGSSESPYLLNNATDPGNSTAKSSKKGKNAELEEDWANMFARLSIVAR